MSKTPLKNIAEAQSGQEWAHANNTNATVKSVIDKVKSDLFGTLKLPDKGKLAEEQQQSIRAVIAEDTFAEGWVKQQLQLQGVDYVKTKKSIDVRNALEMLVEIRAYLGCVSRLGGQLSRNKAAFELIKKVAASGDKNDIPKTFKGDFENWKQDLLDKARNIESDYLFLPNTGRDRLQKSYTAWLSRGDITSLSLSGNNDAQLTKDAETAVTKAKTSKSATDISDADAKVAAMTDTTRQAELQKEMQDLKDAIVIEKSNKEAEDAVVKAKASKSAADITDAKAKVAAMADKARAGVLQGELTDLEDTIANEKLTKDAETAVTKAKTSKSATDISDADAKVAAMTDTTRQAELQKEMQDLKDAIVIEKSNKEAEDAVVKAKASKNTADIADAKAKVAAMADKARAGVLQGELTDLETNVDAEKSVAQAEASNAISDYEKARRKVDVLNDDSEKNGLNDRLDAVLKNILDKKPTFNPTPLELEQNSVDPDIEVTDALPGEKMYVEYFNADTGRTARKAFSGGTGGGLMNISLPGLRTNDLKKEPKITITRTKDGIEGDPQSIIIKLTPEDTEPEKPLGIQENMVMKGDSIVLRGKLKNPKHTVSLCDEAGTPLPGVTIKTNATTGEFNQVIKRAELGIEFRGPHNFILKVSDTASGKEHDTSITVNAESPTLPEKIEKLEKPRFTLPNTELTEEKNIDSYPITLENAREGTKVTIVHPDLPGGKHEEDVDTNGTFTIDIQNFKPTRHGTNRIRVEYSVDAPHTAAKTSSEKNIQVKKKPDVTPPSPPEDVPNTIDITSEPYKLSGKLVDPNHTVEIMDGTTPVGKPKVDKDGKFGQIIPPFADDEYEKNIEMRITNGTDTYTHKVKIRKNIKPEKQEIISGYDLGHITEEFEKKKVPQPYRIKGHGSTDFLIGKMKKKEKDDWVRHTRWYAQVPDDHGHFSPAPLAGTPSDNLVYADSKEELIKKIHEKLHHINHHAELGYNSAFGISTPHAAEGHGDSHGEKPGDKKDDHDKEKHDKGHDEKPGDKKDDHDKEKHDKGHDEKGHKDDHGESHEGAEHSAFDNMVHKLGHGGLAGFIAKTIIGTKNLIPKFIRNSAKGLTKTAIGGVAGGAAITGGAMFASYAGWTAIGMTAASSIFWPATLTVGTVAGSVRMYKWWKGDGKDNHGGDHAAH